MQRLNNLTERYYLQNICCFIFIISLIILAKFRKKENYYFSHIFGYIHTVFLLVALGHSCMNPFIYFWTDARVRLTDIQKHYEVSGNFQSFSKRYGFLDMFGRVPGVKRCFPNIKWGEHNLCRR